MDPATGRLQSDDAVRRRPDHRSSTRHSPRPAGARAGRPGRGRRRPDRAGQLRQPAVERATAARPGRAGARRRSGRRGCRHVTFPGTMVDRIVPATTAETLARARTALGVRDLAAVAAEPYRQWVIEDAFPGGRPAWERAGAVLTGDVAPWERLKLRALNGVHSALAYLGALAGCGTIAEALRLPGMRRHAGAVPRRGHRAELHAADRVSPWSSTASRCWSGSPTRRSSTAPCRSPWTARRSCRSGYCTPCSTGARPAPTRCAARWSSRPGCGSSAAGPTTVGALPLDDPLADADPGRAGRRRRQAGGCGGGAVRPGAVFPAELAGDDVSRRDAGRGMARRALDRHGVARRARSRVRRPMTAPGGADRCERARPVAPAGHRAAARVRPAAAGRRCATCGRSSPRPARRYRTARGCSTTTGSCCAAVRPDVAVICTPPHTHLAIALDALRAGCDMLLEKPPVLSLAEHHAARGGAGRDRPGLPGRLPGAGLGRARPARRGDRGGPARYGHRDRRGRLVAARRTRTTRGRPGRGGAAWTGGRCSTVPWPTRSPTR